MSRRFADYVASLIAGESTPDDLPLAIKVPLQLANVLVDEEAPSTYLEEQQQRLASMVEGEAQVPSERPLVAAVIYNRLHAHMPLGIDATLRYGLHIPPTESLTQSELQNPTPYNTRMHGGLPPTPINNPGIAALEAAANPAKVDYLYFVRKPDHKHHYFTANYQDFLQHEAQYGY